MRLASILCAIFLFGSAGTTVFASEVEDAHPGGGTGSIGTFGVEADGGSVGDSGGDPSDADSSDSGSDSSGTIVMTGYSLQHPGGGEFTGQLKKDDRVNLILNIVDDRTEDGYIPNIRLDTESFTIAGQGDIVCNPKTLSSNGKYKLTFNNLTYTGSGKTFACKIFYNKKNSAGRTVNAGLEIETISVEINQAISATDEAETPEKGTGFILKEASYGQDSVYAGKDFSLSASIMATNGANSVENVTVSITPPKEIALTEGSSINYIGTIAPGQTIPVAFSLKPAANIEEGSYDIVLDVKGVDAVKGDDVTAAMSVTVPVLQPERFELFNAITPSNLMVGIDDGSGYAEFTLVNQGQGLVSNVSAEITGEGLSSQEGKVYVGNVAGGEQKTADFTLTASMPGTLYGKAVITYENTRGEIKELTHEFTVEVIDGMPMDPGDGMIDPGFMEEPEELGVFDAKPWLLPVIIIAACAVGAIFILRFVRKKRAAAAVAEEALLDDQFADEDDEE